jgi:hypothetical protein
VLLSQPRNSTSLSLSSSLWGVSVSGTLPSLSAYTALTSLTINNTALSGTIPAWIGALTNLKMLTIMSAALSGTIPDIFGNLMSLTYLNLNNNQLNGTLPASITNLQSLQCLDVGNNNLNGSLTAAQVSFFNQMYANSWLVPTGLCYPTVVLNLGSNAVTQPATSAPPSPGAASTSALQTQIVALNSTVAVLNSLVAALQVNLTVAQAACAAAG